MTQPAEIQARFHAEMVPASLTTREGASLWMHRTARGKQLALLAPKGHAVPARFSGEAAAYDAGRSLLLCPLTYANAYALQRLLPNLAPVPLGLQASAGTGDRLGMATPGHARAFERVQQEADAQPLAAVFAQQSIREMDRTRRSPAAVIGDATWGAFEAGWRASVGADADHLKVPADIDACVAAGYSFYTIDPGAHVNSEADAAGGGPLDAMVDKLRWPELECSRADMQARYAGKLFSAEEQRITLEPLSLWRAAAKYGNAIAHVTRMYRHLAGKGVPFELEVSVDETETPTTHAEHVFIVSELARLGVRWVSLAPRYVGRFEKGVDYIGDLDALRADLRGHAAIARAFGPYKLSLHSGSDKFSVYPLIVEAARGVVHLKTAGTSYLEALRVIAQVDAAFFRQIAALARERYPTDRATYHVSAELSRVPKLSELRDDQLASLLDQFDARQVLHVTFGSVLAAHGEALAAQLRAHEQEYSQVLEAHFIKHLSPFAHGPR